MLNFLKGKKSVLTGIAGVLTGVVLIINGDTVNGIQTILGGAGIIFLRAGMAK